MHTSMRADVRLGGEGRVFVPAPMRRALGFRSGERLVARIEKDRLVIEKPRALERRIQARFRKVTTHSLASELIAERRQEVLGEER